MDRNKLAILINQLGGYDETERVIGVDAELLQGAIQGEQLNHFETDAIDTAFGKLLRHPELAAENGIDFAELFGTSDYDKGLTSDLDLAIDRLYDVGDGNIFREKVADGLVDIDDLNLYFGLFNNLAPGDNQRGKIIEYLRADSEYYDAERDLARRRHSGKSLRYQLEAIDEEQEQAELEVSDGLKEMLEAYVATGGNIWKDESEFWEWFRETFYGDE